MLRDGIARIIGISLVGFLGVVLLASHGRAQITSAGTLTGTVAKPDIWPISFRSRETGFGCPKGTSGASGAALLGLSRLN
jgi:hypothetical protein